MKLYEIDQGIRTLWDKIIEQDGELSEEDIQALESLELAKDEKIKGYGVVIRETIADITRLNEEMARLKKIERTMNNKVEWLTSRLSNFMQEHKINEYKSLEVNIGFRTSRSLYIEDGAKLAKKWLKVETKPDRQAIKDFINAGGKVKGCQIVENNKIQIK